MRSHNFVNVVADTTGTIFWQDTTNNTVWFKVKTHSLSNAFGSYANAALIYKNVSIAVTA